MTDLSLDAFALLIANLFRAESDDHVLSIGDWAPSAISERDNFHPAARITVGDVRRWAREAGHSPVVGLHAGDPALALRSAAAAELP